MSVKHKYIYIYIYRNRDTCIDRCNRYIDTATKVITTFLALILTLNNFIFVCTHYLQIKRCAMGTICAPAYANIFMENFELKYIYPYIKHKTKIFIRFINDLFMIWTGSEQ